MRKWDLKGYQVVEAKPSDSRSSSFLGINVASTHSVKTTAGRQPQKSVLAS